MKSLLSLILPYGVLLAILALASLMFGADTPMISYLFSALLLLVAGAGLLTSRLQAVPPGALAALALLTAWLVFDMMTGRFERGSVDYAVLYAALGVFTIGFAAGRKNSRIKPFWQGILAIFLMIALWAFTDFIINPETIHGQARPYHQDRLSAAFLSANTAATFFGIALLVSLASLLRAISRTGTLHIIPLMEGLFRHALLPLMTFLFSAVCLVLTASRAGLAFAVIALVVLVVWEVLSNRRSVATDMAGWGRTAGLGVLALAVAGIFFWVMSGDVAGARYAELEDGADMRKVMFAAYWEAAQAKPLTGYGFNTFSLINRQAMTAENAHILASQGAAHNAGLQWLIQAGWLGLLLMWGVLIYLLGGIWRGLARRKRYRIYLRAVLVVSLFVSLHSMVDYGIEIPGLMWWWALLLGFASGIATGKRGGKQGASRSVAV